MRVLILICLFLVSIRAFAQKIDNTVSYRDIDSNSYFRFHYDNDYFAATDENYTQGYNFEVVLNALQKNPINHLFFKSENSISKYGISLEHIGFTPNDYVSEEIQFGDRPFAAAIMLKSFMVSTNSTKNQRLSQSFSLGLIGPGAFGKEMQVEIHRATGNKIPGGWDNQIKNDIVLNYRVDYEKQLLNSNWFELKGKGTLQLGTFFTNASLGINTLLGLFNSIFENEDEKKGFQIYFYGEPTVSVIGYDASLQGGLFNSKSPYIIPSSEIERVTGQFNYGLIVKTKTLYFEYARSAITKEFSSGSSAKWGGIRVGFTF